MEQSPKKLHLFLICTGLVLAVFIAYEPLRHNDFVSYETIRMSIVEYPLNLLFWHLLPHLVLIGTH
jgi:hypothetical protein